MRTQKNDMQFSEDFDAGACHHDYVSVVSRRAQLIQIQLAVQKDVRLRLIDIMPAMNRIPNLRFLSYICALNVMCHRLSFGRWCMKILMVKDAARVLVQDLSRWKLHLCSEN
jgi:hypothetical protein